MRPSLGIAGSYGVGGVAKFSGAISADVGNTHAEGAKNLSITLNDLEWAGVEYIDFDNLGVDELIACLKTNVGSQVVDILDKYLDMHSLVPNDSARRARYAKDCFGSMRGSGHGLHRTYRRT